MNRSIVSAVLVVAVAAVGYFYFDREQPATGPTLVSQPSTQEAESRAISPVDDAVIDVGAKTSPVSSTLQAETQPAVSKVLRSETQASAVRSLEDRLLVGQQYSQKEMAQQIRTPEGFTMLFEDLAAQDASDANAAEMTQLFQEQFADVLEESQSDSEFRRVACSARLCAIELESPEGSDLTSLASSINGALHSYSSVASRSSFVGQPISTRLVLIVDPNVQLRRP